MKLDNILNAAKAQKSAPKQPQQSQMPSGPRISEGISSSDIDSLDNMVFGAPVDDGGALYEQYPNGQVRKVYDPNEEMEAIKRGGTTYANAGNSNMPTAILESIINNPLEVSPIDSPKGEIMDTNMQNRAMDIINKLDQRDNAQKNYVSENRQHPQQPQQPQVVYMQNQQPHQNGYSFKLEDLAGLVESIIDRKFREYGKGMLNESSNRTSPQLGLMTLGDTFKFMDTSGNVYECTMKYVGKGKVKKS